MHGTFQSISARAAALVTKPASPMPYLRISALQRIIVDRYGEARLPDSEAGHDILRPMADHLAQINPARIRPWAAAWMPRLPAADVDDLIVSREALIKQCGKTALYWNADALAHEIDLDDAARTRIRGWTIGAVDCDKAEREERRKIKRAADARAKRAAAGAAPRAQSASATKQWIKDGFNSRSTWERHGKRPRDENSRPAILSSPSMSVTDLRHEASRDTTITTTGTEPERVHGTKANTHSLANSFFLVPTSTSGANKKTLLASTKRSALAASNVSGVPWRLVSACSAHSPTGLAAQPHKGERP